MNQNASNIVVVHLDDDGNMSFKVCGSDVQVLTVDENAPDDRVYEIIDRDDMAEIAALIGKGSVIGNRLDKKHREVSELITGERSGVSGDDESVH